MGLAVRLNVFNMLRGSSFESMNGVYVMAFSLVSIATFYSLKESILCS